MSKSAMAIVDDLLATESHQLFEHKIHNIRPALEVPLYGSETVSSTKRRHFQVHLNRARQAATTSSDADHPKGIELFEHEVHQMIPATCKPVNKSFQPHEQQLLHEVKTNPTGPRSIFGKQLALIETAAEDKAYMAANMTADNWVQFENHQSNAETEATTWSLADTERVSIQLERELYNITSNEQKQFIKAFSIQLIEFEAWWETNGIQTLGKTFDQRVIDFGYPKMHLVSDISEWIHRTGSGDNFTPDISERLHIAKVREAYRSSNKVNYIWQMLKHNDWFTGPDYMEEILSSLPLQRLYNIDSAEDFNLLSATDKRRSTQRAHLLRLHSIEDERIICHVPQQVYHLRAMHVRRVCRSIKLTSLGDASEDFGIPNFVQLFSARIEEDWGHDVCGLVLGYDQNVLIDSIFIRIQNGLL